MQISQLKDDETIFRKIVFTGLDNGGKSTIILTLQRSLAKLATLAPTKMVERSNFTYLGHHFVAHDLGGQKKYLINYLKQPVYFAETETVIYVIDAQDTVRYDESLSYFKDMLVEFKSLNINPRIFVFFHKTERILVDGDPETENELEGTMTKRVDELKEKIVKTCKEAGEFKVEFKLTSVFDIWSITSAFSEIMMKIIPRSELLDKALEEFSNTTGLEALLLLDSNSLIIGNHYQTDEAKDILRASTPYFLTLLDSWKKVGKRKEMTVLISEYAFVFIELYKQGESTSLYFLAMTKGAETKIYTDKLDDFSKIIIGILKI